MGDFEIASPRDISEIAPGESTWYSPARGETSAAEYRCKLRLLENEVFARRFCPAIKGGDGSGDGSSYTGRGISELPSSCVGTLSGGSSVGMVFSFQEVLLELSSSSF